MPITKLADQVLHDYQQRVLDKLSDPDLPGLIAYHSTGSGKTLTALKALQQAHERTGKPGLFITPASLVNNAKKEIGKHNIPLTDKDLKIISYEKAVRDIDNLMQTPYGMVAFDEAHKLRNAGSLRVQKLKKLFGNTDKSLLLTGTAGYNNPVDVGVLAKLINRKLSVPESSDEFEQEYIDPKTGNFRNGDKLQKLLKPYVDVYERPVDSKDFPTVSTEVIRTPMSDKQAKLYRFLLQKLPVHLRKAVYNNLPLKAKDATNLNAFSTGIRQASLSPLHHDVNAVPEDSPKLLLAADRMAEAAKTPRFRGVAYSNYIDAGIEPYAALLRKRGIEPLVFTGGMSAKAKKALVDDYNSSDPKGKVLLLSSSGGEGLDLKGTRRLQILEPHFNQAKIDQVKGRGARYLSHADLPEKDRNLLVEEYHSTMPRRWYHDLFHLDEGRAIDDYLADASARKQRVIDSVKDLLR